MGLVNKTETARTACTPFFRLVCLGLVNKGRRGLGRARQGLDADTPGFMHIVKNYKKGRRKTVTCRNPTIRGSTCYCKYSKSSSIPACKFQMRLH